MRIFEINAPIGQIPTPASPSMPGATAPSGNMPDQGSQQGAPNAPNANPAAGEADRKKQVQVQRKQIQDQIKMLDDQKKALMAQLAAVK